MSAPWRERVKAFGHELRKTKPILDVPPEVRVARPNPLALPGLDEPPPYGLRGSTVSWAVVGFVTGAVVFRYLFASARETALAVQRLVPSDQLRGVLGVGVVGLLGWVLYGLRESNRRVYAVAELSFAAATAWFTAARIVHDQTAAAWAALFGAAYLFVRGLENWNKAKEEDQAKLLATRNTSEGVE